MGQWGTEWRFQRQAALSFACCYNTMRQQEATRVAMHVSNQAIPEAHKLLPHATPVLKLFRGDVILHAQMQGGGLQVLPEGQDVHTLHRGNSAQAAGPSAGQWGRK